MRRLLEVVPSVFAPLTITDEMKALPKRLREEKRALDLCDAFDRLVSKRTQR